MKNSTRLSGHELESEGAPYRTIVGLKKPFKANVTGTGGMGFGLCSCGARSGDLMSGNKRKAWHRAHKEEIRATQKETK